jgi:predicted secreted hydrolase
MRRSLGCLLLAVLLSSASASAADVHAVRLPRDHYAHPGSGIEWWYFTALVRDPAGTRYEVFFTDFSSSGVVVPVAQVRSLDTGALVGHSEALAPLHPGSSSLDLRASGSRLRFDAGSNTWQFSVTGSGLKVSLSQRPEKPYVLHGGGTGVIKQSVAGVSHYYSATRMRASGTLRVGGKTVPLAGESWFDHQWGNYAGNSRAFNWDWFSCRFNDRTELMGYQFLDRKTGRPLPRLANGTFVDAEGHATAIRGLVATQSGPTLSAAGHTWPLDWELKASTPKLTEGINALFPDQLVRNTIVPTFWEGAAAATGTHAGPCLVEISYR